LLKQIKNPGQSRPAVNDRTQCITSKNGSCLRLFFTPIVYDSLRHITAVVHNGRKLSSFTTIAIIRCL
jgi:hypothetical protein